MEVGSLKLECVWAAQDDPLVYYFFIQHIIQTTNLSFSVFLLACFLRSFMSDMDMVNNLQVKHG